MGRPAYFLCVLVLLATAARAESVYYPSQSETAELLLSNQFAKLDQQYGAIQAAYRSGIISDVDLRDAFRTFYPTDARYAEKYREWVTESPKSYVAHLARGIYHKFVGIERRGAKYLSETSEQQLDGMHSEYRIAGEEFRASLTLETKPLLTYLHAMDVEANASGIGAARTLLDRANAIDPKNTTVRLKYMGAIRTQWGGSTAMMKAFLDECRAAGLPRDFLNELEALVLQDEALVRSRGGDNDAAIRAYRKAAKLAPQQACEPCGPLMKAAELAIDSKDFPTAARLASEALTLKPDFAAALSKRGYARLQMRKGQLAAADFLKAAQLGDEYSQFTLAKMLLVGVSIPKDREQGLSWLAKAAEQGNEEAKMLLPILKNPANFIQPSPGEIL